MDPLSIAGLSLAIFDQLLKAGDQTIQVINEIKRFDQDTVKMLQSIQHQNWKSSTLKALFFEKSSVYEDRMLFEHFDADAQQQIQVDLENIFDTLCDAYKVFANQLPTDHSLPTTLPASTSNLNAFAEVLQIRRLNRSPMFNKLKWASYEKKRAASLVAHHAELNNQLRDKMELLLMGSSIGVGLQYLKSVQDNPHARSLGLDENASLLIAAEESRNEQRSFELPPDCNLELESTPVNDRFRKITSKEGRNSLLEICEYRDEAGDTISRQMRHRVDKLVGLLHLSKGPIFRVPRCIGWRYFATQKNVAFLFEVPDNIATTPLSLLSLLRRRSVKPLLRGPSLRDKFALAHALARSIAQLQMVQWVHESLRSANVLFFPSRDPDPLLKTSAEGLISFEKPWIFGFEFSRPDPHFSSGIADESMARNVYRHPERQDWHGGMVHLFQKMHDIYALGVVLLEIGIWEPAIEQERNHFAHAKSPYSVQEHLCRVAERDLGPMGPKYKGIVLKCLTGDFDVHEDTKKDLHLQQAFRLEVVEVLQRALENI